jgi:uncharacterized protein (TIGR03790 family)
MKNSLLLFSILFLLSFAIAEAQTPTDAGIPESQHVLVVYKSPDPNNPADTISQSLANYYKNARNIPANNIVPLPLTRKDITINGVTHPVIIAQETDIIRDSINHELNNGTYTFHAWRYYLDYVATPIREWIAAHNLTSIIRYIVLCKGVPFKIQANADGSSNPGNLTVDGLLCMLNTNTPNYDNFIMNTVFPSGNIPNPYFSVDPELTMDYRFLPDHFTISWEGYTVELSYLVSHLDGISYDVVKSIIDKSKEPDMSGTAAWIIDNESAPHLNSDMLNASNKLEELGFNVVYDETDDWLTSYNGDVIGYTSWGTHAEDGNCEWEDSAWVKDSLRFELANGSVFNTQESFNGNSLTTLHWRYVHSPPPACNHTQGLATQFTEIGGTGTMGHAWEPRTIAQDAILFPAYQLGYNLMDAFYQSLENIGGRNVLVGDPLTRIYECENTVITTNTTIGSGDYQCNIIVPQNVVLTIASGSTINFSRNAALKVYGTLIISENASLNFSGYSKFILDSLSNFTTLENTTLNFEDHSFMTVNSNIIFDGSIVYSFYDDSKMTINAPSEIQGTFYMNLFDRSVCVVNNSMTVAQDAQFNLDGSGSVKNYGTMMLNSGSIFNFSGTSSFYSYAIFRSIGSVNDNATINVQTTSTSSQLNFVNIDTLQLNFTKMNNGFINLKIDDRIQKPRLISITNSVLENCPNTNSFVVQLTNGVNVTLSDNRINCNITNRIGMNFSGLNNVQLLRDTIHNVNQEASGDAIQINNNYSISISNCEILNFKDGIKQGHVAEEDEELVNNHEIIIYDCNISGTGFDQGNGIILDYSGGPEDNILEIVHNSISEFSSCVSVNNAINASVQIKNNILTNFNQNGVSLVQCDDTVIEDNNISSGVSSADDCIGINLSQSDETKILSNIISAFGVTDPGVGIFSVSSNGGEIRNNTIQYHHHGIEFGSSSPFVGANTIMDNLFYGIYISGNSNPDLSESFVAEEKYPLSGYNTIRENGLCSQINYSEIFLNGSSLTLEKGCNTIADDREEQLSCGYLYLIDGSGLDQEINAVHNYWGALNHSNPEGRFGEGVTVNYDDWLEEPCTYEESGSFLILANSKGDVYDTVYSTGIFASGLTDIETRYANANAYYYSNQYSQAKQGCEGIIQNYGNSKESLQAYNRLFTMAGLTNSSPADFTQLKDFYLQKASNQTDSIMIGTLTHLSDLCLVSATEYISAINNFDQIAQQNPNTDLAFYRQIDALTTSLLIPQDSSSLNKGTLGKYSVYNLADYNNKLNELIKTRGKSGLGNEQELLPTEYTLHQNYPNPFNPTTTLKYDLPEASQVSLIIYDILGRKVKELVNTKQQAGRYEVQFNASTLASGVYIYQLVAEKYINSKKMILLR